MGRTTARILYLVSVLTTSVLAFPLHAVAAAEPQPTNASPESQETLRAYLQLQQQLHSATLAIEQVRQEAGEMARRNAESLATRLKTIEQTLTVQRSLEAENLQKTNRLALTIAGVVGGLGLVGMAVTAWVLLRALHRFAQMTLPLPAAHALAAPAPTVLAEGETQVLNLPAGSTRLLGAIERLEKRILELEHTAQLPAPAGNGGPTDGEASAAPADGAPNGETTAQAESEQRVTIMLGKGQALLNLDQPEEALACFEEALGLAPDHAEGLVKKGTALERLKRWEEAIECYDRAIAANHGMTLAYLYKGGVFNQLERFNEALECYEQALRTQQPAETSKPA